LIPAAFEYHRPRTLDQAIGLLAAHGEDALVVAGGHSLVPMMKLRLARPGHLVDLQELRELAGVLDEGERIAIGAMTTQQMLIASELLAAKVPILRETAAQIADPQVRYWGTLGGNLANGDPGNDMPAVMLALDAVYRVRGQSGEREIVAREFYRGLYDTARGAGEILTAIHIPTPPRGHGSAYEKQKRKVGDYATAAAAVVLTMSGGVCRSAAVALTNVADTPLLAAQAAAALVGTPLDDAAIGEAARRAKAIATPAADGRGPADYRAHVAGIMVQRAVVRAAARATAAA
jgi:aerobic carbon-monoxide dehydrogenase medium subunit